MPYDDTHEKALPSYLQPKEYVVLFFSETYEYIDDIWTRWWSVSFHDDLEDVLKYLQKEVLDHDDEPVHYDTVQEYLNNVWEIKVLKNVF